MAYSQTLYFDYAAATPLSPSVQLTMEPFMSQAFYNPSALYLASRDVGHKINEARASVAGILGAKPSEIIFTAGGTEANNLAIHGVMGRFPDSNMVVSAIEHDSVRLPAQKYNVKEVAVVPDGRIDLDDLAKQIDDKTVLVSVMYANNEIGTIQPIRHITKLVTEIRAARKQQGNDRPLYVHTDACQATNYLDLHVHRLGVDLMTLNGGKIYGPKQSGVLFKKAYVELQPLLQGGGQEMGLRSGTENVMGIMGFAAALTEAVARKDAESHRLGQLRDYCFAELQQALPNIEITGSLKHRLPNNVHIQIPGQDNERLIMALDEHGIMCAAGSACSASKDEVSHVLLALGLSEDQARTSLRFTFGRDTDKPAIDQLVKTLLKIAR